MQGNPLPMVAYVTLSLLVEKLRSEDPDMLTPFYINDAAFDGPEGQIVWLMNLLLERGADQRYFLEPAKSLFILYPPPPLSTGQRKGRLRRRG